MKQKIFGADVEPSCAYCELGHYAPEGDVILCNKKGVRAPGASCRRFRYDPFKRIPPPTALPDAADFAAEEFSLDITEGEVLV